MDELAAPAKASTPRPSLRTVALRMAWVACLVSLDLWSKAWVFARLGPPMRPNPTAHLVFDRHAHPRELLLGDWLAFMTSFNPGMAWGFDKLPMHVLVWGRAAAVLLLTWLVARSSPLRPWLSAALLLVLAGALGNLHDNLFTTSEKHPFGEVRDFIDVYFSAFDWHFPTFNVADSCITIGAVLLFATSWKKEPASEAKA